jgi:hypothetical protein
MATSLEGLDERRNAEKRIEIFSSTVMPTGLQGYDLSNKKFQNISCLCTFQWKQVERRLLGGQYKMSCTAAQQFPQQVP